MDRTHPKVAPHTGARPSKQEQAHPNLHPFAGDDRPFTYSNQAVQIRVGLELAAPVCLGHWSPGPATDNCIHVARNS